MMFYVIGKYDDGLNTILDRYESLKDARRAVWWQSQPRMHGPDWDSSDCYSATTTDYFRGGSYATRWEICRPSNLKGFFIPLSGAGVIEVTRGAYTEEAFDSILRQQVVDHSQGGGL